MGVIPPKVHRIIDFVMVLLFATAPFFLVELSGRTRIMSFVLAALILVLALMTGAPGESRPISMKMHKMLDIGLGAVLVVLPLIRSWTHDARWYYLATGAAILVVALLTNDREVAVPAARTV